MPMSGHLPTNTSQNTFKDYQGMSINVKGDIYRYDLKFKEPAMTSRGTYFTHTIWYVTLQVNNQIFIGECAPLPDLSSDFLSLGANIEERISSYESKLKELFTPIFKDLIACPDYQSLCAYEPKSLAFINYPSMLFGLESLLAHLKYQLKHEQLDSSAHDPCDKYCNLTVFDSPFARNKQGIDINGLIWMGDFETMGQRIKNKIDEGFRCIKLKIGAIDFNEELSLLTYIRDRFSPDELELRVDANGAFSFEEAPYKLDKLSKFQLHSIEQPIKAGQYEKMAKLCQESPIAIGLDEELIGVYSTEEKVELIDSIKPQYLVIKPSLHGGFAGTKEWIRLAQERSIDHWITSALESTIGLNTLAQWCATSTLNMPQGLGTGALYTNNLITPMYIHNAKLFCDLSKAEFNDYGNYLNELLNKKAFNILSLA